MPNPPPTTPRRPDPAALHAALGRLAAAHAEPGQPAAGLDALADILAETVGYRLYTVLLHDPAAGHIRRAWTNMPAEYPVGGAKPITDSPWMRQVLGRGEPYVGHDAADIRDVFFDHELIASLGCDSTLNVPVRWDGAVVGTLNLLHRAHWYDDVDAHAVQALAQSALPFLLALHRS